MRLMLSLRRSLFTRLVVISLLLLLLVQVAGFTVVRASIERNARAQIEQALDLDQNVWEQLLRQNADGLRQGATVLAADYGFRSAVGSADEATIHSGLENHGARIGAALTALLDTNLELRSISAAEGLHDFNDTARTAAKVLATPDHPSVVMVIGDTPYQFVMVPMRAPVLVGWVLMGFPIDQRLALEMRRLLAVDVAMMVRTYRGTTSIPISTLLPELLTPLGTQIGPSIRELDTPDGPMLVRTTPVDSYGGEVQTLLLRSVDAVVGPYRELQVLLAIITVAGVLLFALGTGLVARRVTEPLRALMAGTQRLSRGNYDTPMEHLRRRDEIGQLARSFDGMRQDIGKQQNEIRRLAYWDRLTGLPNRERFRNAVVQAIADGSAAGDTPPCAMAVLTLDLDRFKHVNDVLGYAFGDQLLQTVAGRLRGLVPQEQGEVARLGGNEFAVLLPRSNATQALEVAQRILKSFEQPLALAEQTVDLSAGIGLACWPDDAEDADTLLSRSEIAMYAAKSSLSGVLRYAASLDSTSAQTLSLLTELRRAIEQGELRLYLQPKISLTGGPIAAEALVRWQHPERGLVPPIQFIPFAEQTGFVRQLTLWMLDAVAALLARPEVRVSGLRVSVNLSTRDLMDAELATRLEQILGRHGVGPESFCLEITESAIMDDPQRAQAMLLRLSQQGFKLSIDDFGTGYSSMAYLKRLPVSELKVDKSFVMGMETDPDDAIIVRSVIDLAHNLGLSVVAEGVENGAIVEQLRTLQCDEAQGYHISRPVPADDFLRWAAAQAPEAATSGWHPSL